MKPITCFLNVAGVLAATFGAWRVHAAVPAGAETAYTHVTLLGTTDLHGHVFPVNIYNNRPAQLGLAKIATLIGIARLGDPNLLLVDSGDTIQGTPMEYYHARVDNAPPDPMMLAMNSLRYDAMAVGNHDYNYGQKVQQKARGEAKFPWLSANTYWKGTDRTVFQPYIVKEVNGVRVAILGLTTPDVPDWDDPADYAGMEFREPVGEAKKWVEILRTRERADVVVVIMHSGMEVDLSTGQPLSQLPHENCGAAIAEAVPGIDVVFMGHTHLPVPSLTINGVLLTQADYWGYYLARADLYLKRPPGGSWRVWAKKAALIPVAKDTSADPAVLALAANCNRATDSWLERPIGQCAKTLTEEDCRAHENAIINLVQRTELEAGHADVALAAPFNLAATIAAGPVTVRDLYSVYVYDNTLAVVELTGRQLKEALEQSARYFRPYRPGATAEELMDHRIPSYNFETAIGVSYVIDLRRAPGDRIVDLRYQGAPLDPDRKLRVATNNYRLNGGGGYTMIKNAPVLSMSGENLRDVMIEWVERHHDIPDQPMNNWRIVPSP